MYEYLVVHRDLQYGQIAHPSTDCHNAALSLPKTPRVKAVIYVYTGAEDDNMPLRPCWVSPVRPALAQRLPFHRQTTPTPMMSLQYASVCFSTRVSRCPILHNAAVSQQRAPENFRRLCSCRPESVQVAFMRRAPSRD